MSRSGGDLIMKKYLFRFLISGIVLFFIIIAVALVIIKNSTLSYFPESTVSVNYNNYCYGNVFDAQEGYFACLDDSVFSSGILLSDVQGNSYSHENINTPFMIYKDSILAVKKKKLCLVNIETGDEKILSETAGVETFIVWDDNVYYIAKSEDLDTSSLYIYDFTRERSCFIYEDVRQMLIHNGKMLVVTGNNEIVEISEADYSAEILLQLDVHTYPYTLLSCDNKLLLYEYSSCFELISLENGESEQIPLFDETAEIKNMLFFRKVTYHP